MTDNDALLQLLNQPKHTHTQHSAREAHQRIHNRLATKDWDSLTDQEILQRLREQAEIAQTQFEGIDSQLSESTRKVQQLASQAHDELHTLKPMCEGVHEEFIKYEDDYIDYYESLMTTRLSADKNPGTALGDGGSKSSRLVDAMAEQLGWLQELRKLKLWFTVLLGFRERTHALLQSANQPAPHASAATHELDALADQLFELVQSYQEFRALAYAPSGHRTHLHLYEYIHQILRQSLHALIDVVSAHVAQVLEDEIEWPQPSRAPLDLQSPSTARILSSFKTAVHFQNKLSSQPQLVSLAEKRPDEGEEHGVVWLPLAEGSVLLKAILQPIVLRFRFHFDGQRPTNRLDKPEWYFNHVLDRLLEHQKFIQSDMQKLFDLSGQGYIQVFHGFTVHLIKLVEKKLKRSVPGILDMKPILAHTIEKAVAFDHAIYQMNYLSPPAAAGRSAQWLGTADGILSNPHWFTTWFEAEKRFVNDMCLEIISSKDTWELHWEDERASRMQVPGTNSAVQMQEVVEQIKSKYEGLPRLSYQVEFLIKMQLEVLEQYSQRIAGVLDGFERSRLIHVVAVDLARAKVNAGIKGLERLVKVYMSANCILVALKSWDDDLFYAELYDKLKREKLAHNADVEALLKSIEETGGMDGTLFSPLVARFEELSRRAEAGIVRQVVQEVTTELKPYFAKRWDLADEETSEGEGGGGSGREIDELSTEIVAAMSVWKSRMGYLAGTVGPVVKLHKLGKQIGKEVERKLLEQMVFHPFSIRAVTLRGALQFEFDVVFGWLNVLPTTTTTTTTTTTPSYVEGMDDYLARPGSWRLAKYFSKLMDCCKLLAYPHSSVIPSSSSSNAASPLPPFDHLVKLTFGDSVDGNQDDDGRWTSFAKERLGFSSSLSRAECQLVLKRRPECWRS
ncbi:hypothetical protein PCANC_08061 [Puccinia coronata f. sp. avenae]|uniref:RAD50-interacting protein 1 n=1 Tax=Puccinia coronata f. sp. avenae TaxID=200324 RepID=A0A2N5V6W2_9BASI|nr:hypothetical protein PCANC_08061 [Puccinia coronata f. sp. avenae]